MSYMLLMYAPCSTCCCCIQNVLQLLMYAQSPTCCWCTYNVIITCCWFTHNVLHVAVYTITCMLLVYTMFYLLLMYTIMSYILLVFTMSFIFLVYATCPTCCHCTDKILHAAGVNICAYNSTNRDCHTIQLIEIDTRSVINSCTYLLTSLQCATCSWCTYNALHVVGVHKISYMLLVCTRCPTYCWYTHDVLHVADVHIMSYMSLMYTNCPICSKTQKSR